MEAATLAVAVAFGGHAMGMGGAHFGGMAMHGMGGPGVGTFLDGAELIVTPAFVSQLCICIVFVPMFFLTGVRFASGLCRSTSVPDEAAHEKNRVP